MNKEKHNETNVLSWGQINFGKLYILFPIRDSSVSYHIRGFKMSSRKETYLTLSQYFPNILS